MFRVFGGKMWRCRNKFSSSECQARQNIKSFIFTCHYNIEGKFDCRLWPRNMRAYTMVNVDGPFFLSPLLCFASRWEQETWRQQQLKMGKQKLCPDFLSFVLWLWLNRKMFVQLIAPSWSRILDVTSVFRCASQAVCVSYAISQPPLCQMSREHVLLPSDPSQNDNECRYLTNHQVNLCYGCGWEE